MQWYISVALALGCAKTGGFLRGSMSSQWSQNQQVSGSFFFFFKPQKKKKKKVKWLRKLILCQWLFSIHSHTSECTSSQYIRQIQSVTEAKGFLFVCFLYLKFSLTSLTWEIPKPCNNLNQPLYGFLLLVSFAEAYPFPRFLDINLNQVYLVLSIKGLHQLGIPRFISVVC